MRPRNGRSLDIDAHIMAPDEFRANSSTSRPTSWPSRDRHRRRTVLEVQLIRGATRGTGAIDHIARRSPTPNVQHLARAMLPGRIPGWRCVALRLRELGRIGWSRKQCPAGCRATSRPSASSPGWPAGRPRRRHPGDVHQPSNPHVLIVGGDLEPTQAHSLAALRGQLCQRTWPLVATRLRVLTSTVDDRSGIFGAVRLVDDIVHCAEPVERMLAG